MSKVLAVDDDEGMKALYGALFAEAGYEVRTASDAASAMDVYYEFKPDIMVLDADIPEGGGERMFAITRSILSVDVPVIFVTGLPERVSHFALLHTHVRVFAKPVDQQELLRCVAGMLRQ